MIWNIITYIKFNGFTRAVLEYIFIKIIMQQKNVSKIVHVSVKVVYKSLSYFLGFFKHLISTICMKIKTTTDVLPAVQENKTHVTVTTSTSTMTLWNAPFADSARFYVKDGRDWRLNHKQVVVTWIHYPPWDTPA